ncbi:hypothetical protein HD806DRAFT_452353 [Xylariaceae sp. AK1471]|nr:hypothetical protein HD806DRAFT_452353 [Xylariaceae sp. AK1471]
MALADAAIVGIVALLVMCIPGVQYLSRLIRRRLRPRRTQVSESNTLLPLSERFSPTFRLPNIYPQAASVTPIDGFGTTSHVMHVETSENSGIHNLQGFVAISMSAAMIWPAVEIRPTPHTRHQHE